jgi:hypothetical protein
MTTARQRRIRRERRRRRDEKIAHTLAPIKAIAKFFFVMVATLVFGAVLVANIEENPRMFITFVELVAMFFFALWVFAKVFHME